MTEYKDFLASKGIQSKATQSGCELVRQPVVDDPKLGEQVESLFKSLDTNNDGFIGTQDAERLLLQLNSVYGRNYGESDSKAFFSYLAACKNSNIDQNGSKSDELDLNTFKKAFGLD